MSTYSFEAIIFDLDGVITQTAHVHALAWKEAFDEYLKMREERDNEPFKEFTHEHDYLPYVDGKPRYEGVKSFLESRGIDIPFGEPTDDEHKETVCGIGNSKNEKFTAVLMREGCEIYEPAVAFLKSCKQAGIHVAVASSSKNCKTILEKVGLLDLMEARVDGVVSAERGLNGKPEGDIFVTACRDMGCDPGKAVVIEDATSGVAAGRNGGFRLVIGLARENDPTDLLAHGADIAAPDMSNITLAAIEQWFTSLPLSLDKTWDTVPTPRIAYPNTNISVHPRWNRSFSSLIAKNKKCVFFLDYDGTLTPIVDRPECAVMDDGMREVIKEVLKKHTVSIVSGRQREVVEDFVKLDGIFYAGSHGFDIVGPGFTMINPEVEALMPEVDEIITTLENEIGSIENAFIEKKKFSVAAHYRLVKNTNDTQKIKTVVEKIVAEHSSFRLMAGKMVFEILPNIDWNKGMALRWIMEAMKVNFTDQTIFYIGDDVTDEYALRVIQTRGIGMYVGKEAIPSSAHYYVQTPNDIKEFFTKILEIS